MTAILGLRRWRPSRSRAASSCWSTTRASTRTEDRDASALFYVRGFMTEYTSLDPVPRQRLCGPHPGSGHRRLREVVQGEAERDRHSGRAGRTHHGRGPRGRRTAVERQRQRRHPGGDQREIHRTRRQDAHRERNPLGRNDYRGGTAVEDQSADSSDLTADAAAASVPQGKAARNRHRLPRQKAQQVDAAGRDDGSRGGRRGSGAPRPRPCRRSRPRTTARGRRAPTSQSVADAEAVVPAAAASAAVVRCRKRGTADAEPVGRGGGAGGREPADVDADPTPRSR